MLLCILIIRTYDNWSSHMRTARVRLKPEMSSTKWLPVSSCGGDCTDRKLIVSREFAGIKIHKPSVGFPSSTSSIKDTLGSSNTRLASLASHAHPLCCPCRPREAVHFSECESSTCTFETLGPLAETKEATCWNTFNILYHFTNKFTTV